MKALPKTKFKVASVQLNVGQNIDDILSDVRKYLAAAKKKKVGIVCFPECSFDSGNEKNAAALREVRTSCKDAGIWCIIGCNLGERGRTYNTAVLINDAGRIVGRHRKVHLCDPPGVRPGKGFAVFDTPFGRIGISICWDTSFPQTVSSMAAKGAKVIFVPLMWYFEKWAHDREHRSRERQLLRSMILTRAYESLVYVVFSNVYDPTDRRMVAYSAIAESQRVLKEIVGKEGMIVADVDIGHLDKLRKMYLKEYNKKIV
ncbi:MAG: carbon-nitrogen hydrolase family protein [Candidatus Aenigmarchaeota archaeon]|nr:carbon-nitrogen hydrolase family protein [Candidatus Aenigmarchaeota archaeon]